MERSSPNNATYINQSHLWVIFATDEHQQIAGTVEQLQGHAHMSVGKGVE